MLKLILLVASATIFILILISIFIFRHKFSRTFRKNDIENPSPAKKKEATEAAMEELTTFDGGEGLTIDEILEAPGEVVGKSHYGTLYKALLQSTQQTRLLRFLRPAAAGTAVEDSGGGVVGILGSIRHRNLVPMVGFYSGGRGERLLVYPFYDGGNLAEFIRGNSEPKNWELIYKITLGIAKALNHLHHGLPKPVTHGNLKSNNILLDQNFEPHISDSGLHLLLNAAATRQMLQVSAAAAGYKAPELVDMADAGERTDVYSYGKILLELITAKEPTDPNPVAGGGDGGDCVIERNLRCLFRIGEACCSSSPMNRPNFKEVIARIEEIGRIDCGKVGWRS